MDAVLDAQIHATPLVQSRAERTPVKAHAPELARQYALIAAQWYVAKHVAADAQTHALDVLAVAAMAAAPCVIWDAH